MKIIVTLKVETPLEVPEHEHTEGCMLCQDYTAKAFYGQSGDLVVMTPKASTTHRMEIVDVVDIRNTVKYVEDTHGNA